MSFLFQFFFKILYFVLSIYLILRHIKCLYIFKKFEVLKNSIISLIIFFSNLREYLKGVYFKYHHINQNSKTSLEKTATYVLKLEK